MNRKLGVMLVAVSILAGIASAADKASPSAVDPAYLQSFEKWKGDLVADLKQEWLPLAGLFWLKPGENSFGTDPRNAVVFPKGPAQIAKSRFDLLPGPVGRGDGRPDADADHPQQQGQERQQQLKPDAPAHGERPEDG